MDWGYNAWPPQGRNFREYYRVYSVAMMGGRSDSKARELEKGGKIIMPPSALEKLSHLDIDWPVLFEISNDASNRTTHAGVLEFVADEGKVYMPHWMMRNLALEEGSVVNIRNVSLPPGTFAKFEPQTVDFLDISNPRAVMESILRGFACLSEGDVIALHYNDKVFELRVIETKPAKGISIIECDLNVDFAPPVGYVEPQRMPMPPPSISPANDETASIKSSNSKKGGFVPFGGGGMRLAPTQSKGKKPRRRSTSITESNDSQVPSIHTVTSVASLASMNSAVDDDDDDDIEYIPGRLVFTLNHPKAIASQQQGAQSTEANARQQDTSAAAAAPERTFEAFKGSGRRLG